MQHATHNTNRTTLDNAQAKPVEQNKNTQEENQKIPI